MPSNILMPLRVLWKRRGLERSCRWTRAKLRMHQSQAERAIRQYAYQCSPFYRRFHAGLESHPLSELPILSKATLMENFDDLVTDRSIRLREVEDFLGDNSLRLYREQYVALATSGSTGRRGVFLFNEKEWLTAVASIARPIGWAGIQPNPFRPARTAMVTSTTASHYSARVGLSVSSRLIPTLRLDAAEPLESMVRRLNQWQPEVLVAYPSILRQLSEEQIQGRLQVPIRHVATSAEVLTAETRKRVTQAWPAKIYDTYGATEYAPIAAECSYGRKHLFEDGAIIEVVDERGRPVPPGTAGDRILLTIFNRRTQPLIRYEISDMVRPVAGECECGRPFQLIEAVEGRLEDVLSFPAGNGSGRSISIHPNTFHRILENAPVTGWQVVQDDDELRVNLTGLRDAAWRAQIESAVRRLLEREGAANIEVRVRDVEQLQRGATGKTPLIVSNTNRKSTEAVTP
jgi:putative adenylate-forming enzyme